jgi:outer membrane lipoprotein-sorting protein
MKLLSKFVIALATTTPLVAPLIVSAAPQTDNPKSTAPKPNATAGASAAKASSQATPKGAPRAPVKTAANAKAAPKRLVDPAAVQVLERAIAVYKRPKGVLLKIEATIKSERRDERISATLKWKLPNLFRCDSVTTEDGEKTKNTTASDGKAIYTSYDDEYFMREPLDADEAKSSAGIAEEIDAGNSHFLVALLAGSKTAVLDKTYGEGSTVSLTLLPQKNVEGRPCIGVRRQEQFPGMGPKGSNYSMMTTAWFDAKRFLLLRVETVGQSSSRMIAVDRFTATDLNPKFDSKTFVWKAPAGAKDLDSEDYTEAKPKPKAPLKVPPKTAPQADPAAVALLDRTIAAYRKSGKGKMTIQATVVEDEEHDMDNWTTVQWQAPNRVRLDYTTGQGSVRYNSLVVSDGKTLWEHTTRDGEMEPDVISLAGRPADFVARRVSRRGARFFISSFLTGGKQLFLKGNAETRQLRIGVLPAKVVEGHLCRGLRRTDVALKEESVETTESTFWIDAKTYQLRRVQLVIKAQEDGEETESLGIERIIHTDFNPTFTPDTFRWVKPAPKKSVATAKPAAKIDPAAVELLNTSIAAYKAASGVRLKMEATATEESGKQATPSATVQWQAPNLIRLEIDYPVGQRLVVSDGTSLYDYFRYYKPKTFSRLPLAGLSSEQVVQRAGGQTGLFGVLSAVLSGNTDSLLKSPPRTRLEVQRLKPQLVDGRICNGLRRTETRVEGKSETVSTTELTAWFDANDHTLRRTQTLERVGVWRKRTVVERVTATDLAPQFAPETFTWSPPADTTEELATP